MFREALRIYPGSRVVFELEGDRVILRKSEPAEEKTRLKEVMSNMSTVTQKYQATIPKEVRKKLKIKPGDKIVFFEEPRGKFVVMKEDEFIKEIAGLCEDIEETVKESRKGFAHAVKKTR
ncbi:MAG: type II toxin-antitoxin system PrlF family antitoxin [Thaumarchaeota archaeon]|nr:type II toxin-antitoxin system PrlF family antitoxin [Nitrososphaerota archaeon]MCL5318239.1 type II toxin-antitoxin system PrlF family antitoxin [Nitrososphaerota archaeon]